MSVVRRVLKKKRGDAYLRRLLTVGIRNSLQVRQSSVSSVIKKKNSLGGLLHVSFFLSVTQKRWCPNSNPIYDDVQVEGLINLLPSPPD